MRAIEQVCRDCDFDASTATPNGVAAALPALSLAIADDMRSVPADRVRTRPAPEVWSAVEYLGHLKESMAFHRWLIEKALAEDDPVVPMVDPDASVAAAGYDTADVDELIGQFDRRLQRLGKTLETISGETALRTLRLGDDRISMALIARSAWHECHHHGGDIRRIGAPEADA